MIGRNEGETCGDLGCPGVLTVMQGPDCSCHISPPCDACVEHGLRCSLCDRDADDPEAGTYEDLDGGTLDLGQFPHFTPGQPVPSAFLIALGDEPDAVAAIGPKTRFA